MKYLFINTVCFGSTGKIVEYLGNEFIKNGDECVLIYGRGKPFKSFACEKIGNLFSLLFHVFLSKVFDLQGRGSYFCTKKIIKYIKKYNPDCIWIHNIHGYFINYKLLFNYLKTLNIQIKWTLHDCWALTGHCCYFSEINCNKWEKVCNRCPQRKTYPSSIFSNSQRNLERKKQSFTHLADLELFVPSVWLQNIVKDSFLGKYKITLMSNPINKEIFKHTKINEKKNLNILDKKLLLGVANVWDKRKGLDRFIKLSEKLDSTFVIVLVGLSKKQIKKLPEKIIGIERVGIEKLVGLYSSADLFLNLSTEETFGMTTLEASLCNTSVLVLKNTACEEVAKMCKNSFIVKNNIDLIAKKINDIFYE